MSTHEFFRLLCYVKQFIFIAFGLSLVSVLYVSILHSSYRLSGLYTIEQYVP